MELLWSGGGVEDIGLSLCASPLRILVLGFQRTEVRQTAELPDVSRGGGRELRSLREVFNAIFELRSCPLSMHSTYTIQQRSKVTGRHSTRTTDDKWMSKAYGMEGNDKHSMDQ